MREWLSVKSNQVQIHFVIGLNSVMNSTHKTLQTYYGCRYKEIPIISRVYLTVSIIISAACAVEVLDPYKLYLNWNLIQQGQVKEKYIIGQWPLVTDYHL
jgi:hypothetical protein